MFFNKNTRKFSPKNVRNKKTKTPKSLKKWGENTQKNVKNNKTNINNTTIKHKIQSRQKLT